MKVKSIAMIMAIVMMVVGLVSGTLAWLTDSTGIVQNTFTTSGIDIDLTETYNTASKDGGDLDIWKGKMVPGHTLSKNPVVTVNAKSEKCYLFVKVEKSENLDNFIAYNLACEDTSTWTELEGVDGVYYTVVDAVGASDKKEFHLLKAGSFTDDMGTTDETDDYTVTYKIDEVAVKPSVTKEMMDNLTEDKYPTMTFTAYASQYFKDTDDPFTPAEAWANVPKS